MRIKSQHLKSICVITLTGLPALCLSAGAPELAELSLDEIAQELSNPVTALASIGWNPSISVPAGLSSDGLPIGLLINTRRHRDDVALRLARISEQANPWPLRAPGY